MRPGKRLSGERCLRGVKFIASDDHAGLKAARKAMFPGVPWQRCQFHLQHNAQGYVSKIDQRTVVARQSRSIFSAPDVHEATRLLNIAIEGWGTAHPKLAAWGFCRVSDKKTSVGPSARLRVTLDGFVLPMHKIGRQTTSYRCRRNGVVPCESCA